MMPRKNADEMRSYRYFLDVTAPGISGSFDVSFWMQEVPRACFVDPAVWHAVVSLGSVYEYYTTLSFTGHKPDRNVFALQQFNSAIRHLTASAHSPVNKWQALTVSIIFMCICVMESLFDEARMHFRYGYNLLQEIERDVDAGVQDQSLGILALEGEQGDMPTSLLDSNPAYQGKPIFNSPVSMDSLKCILSCFELREVALFNGGSIQMPSILSEKDLYRTWLTYTPPSESGEAALSIDNLTFANKAAQSLLNSFMVFSQDNASDLVAVFEDSPPQEVLDSLNRKRRPLLKCFVDIETAIGTFQDELGPDSVDKKCSPKKAHERAQLRLSFLSLRLYHEINRFVLAQYPDRLNEQIETQDHDIALSTASCGKILDLAEETETLQNILRAWGGGMPPPPIASITVPVFMVTLMGQSWRDRRRALKILQRPRLEGFLEHSMATSLANAIMEREMEISKEYTKKQQGHVTGEENGDGNWEEAEDDEDLESCYHPMCRVNTTDMKFSGGRQAVIEMKTWHEVTNGLPGKTLKVEW